MSSDDDEGQATSEEKVKHNENKFYRSVFNKFDKNKSGDIELTEMIERLENDDEVPREITENVFNAADKNKNGALDFEEFKEMVKDDTYKEVFSHYINMYIRYVLPRNKKHFAVQVDGIYEEKYTCWPPPIVLILISTLELTFFIMDETSEEKDMISGSGPNSKIFIYDPYRRQQAWRYLTYMFVHIGYTHLTVNLVVQLFLGFPLEMVHKGWRVMIVYFSGVIAGSLGTSIMDPRTYLAGASGGVYALITGHIGTIFMNWSDMEFPALQLAFFLFITFVDVGTSIYKIYFLKLNENVGYVAHISGAIAGLLVGIWNLKNFEPSRKETYIWWGAVTVYVIFMGAMILLNVFWSEHFLPSSWK